MRRFWILTGAMMALFLGLFLIAEALHVPLLTDPSPWLSGGGSRGESSAALVGVGLLVADVVLPVPASLVMIAHGALFGPVLGTLLSLTGALGAGLFAFGIGRRGGPLLDRLLPQEERRRADALLEQWGGLAILVTRPVPIVAETVSVLAGTSRLGWGRMAAATVAGSLPAALVYALTGALAAKLDNVPLVFALVLFVAGIFWFAGRRLQTPRTLKGNR